ncbi:MAG: ribosomal-processing cysteine protease Prp [Spirochaetota bacterium]
MHVHQREGRIQRVLIRGHGGGMSGSDLVCAAVSAVAQTTLRGLLHYAGGDVRWRHRKGELRIELDAPAQDPGPGPSGTRAACGHPVGIRSTGAGPPAGSADNPPAGTPDGPLPGGDLTHGPDPREVLLRTLVMGVQSIAREYPDRVRVRVRES